MATHYRIDQAMMGDQWIGDTLHLRRFAEILTEQTGKPAVAETEFYNGAYPRQGWMGEGEGPDFTEEEWNTALDTHAERFPMAWRGRRR